MTVGKEYVLMIAEKQLPTILKAFEKRRQYIRQGIRRRTKEQVDLIEIEALLLDVKNFLKENKDA